jgi:starch-binding outer membrane protein, SusD/RagB family
MRTQILIAIFFAGAFVFGSCKKVLDVAPYTSFSDVTAFSSPERIQLALYGVYDAAQSGFYQGNTIRGYPFGAANIEQADMRGEDMLNQAQFFAFTYESTYNNTSPNNGFMWQTLYALINTANLTIEGVRGAATSNIIPAAAALQFEAECRFLRAMAHHELVLNFARPYADGNGSQLGIMWRDFGINNDATAAQAREIRRGTVAENYTKILEDLDFAETNLPVVVNDLGNTPIKTYRASKAAAIALKMRVKLHKQDWAGVIAEGNKLVPNVGPYVSPIGGWKLTPTPEGPFLSNTSDESIFSIRNDPNDNPGTNAALARMLGSPNLTGRGLVRVSPISYNLPSWLCDDLRRTQLLVNDGRSYYTTKYKDYVNWSDAAPQIRYAEVILVLAEAEARNVAGVSPRAVELLNAVRNRAVTTPGDQYTFASFPTKNSLLQAILDERRIEFLAEGKRWGDIHRLSVDPDFNTGGIPAKMSFADATFARYSCGTAVALPKSIQLIPYADFRFLWPIPLEEVQQNSNIEQNPGY